MSEDGPTCWVIGCTRPGQRRAGGRCWAHAKRKARGQPLDLAVRPQVPRWEDLEALLLEAVVEFRDFDDNEARDREAELAWARVKYAAKQFARGVPPESEDQ